MNLFVANWKMHAPALASWVKTVSDARKDNSSIVLCPPFTLLAAAQMLCQNGQISLGAQDCHYRDEGAFTGDISAQMLKKIGCNYVIVGHSERRQYHYEQNETIKAKADSAIDHGLVPIICIGEQKEEREQGEHEAVVAAQLKACLPQRDAPVIIAYEPVWAIGTGLSATPDDISAMHSHIKKMLESDWPVLYGGSVKAATAGDILSIDAVDGVLVGSASLKPEEFAGIIESV